jgi:hypothetical protein
MDITTASRKVAEGENIDFKDLEKRSLDKDVWIYVYSNYQADYREICREELEEYEEQENPFETEIQTQVHPRRAYRPHRAILPDLKSPNGHHYTELMTRAAGETLRPMGYVDDYVIVEIEVRPAKKPLKVFDPFNL